MATADAALERLCDPAAEVSAHYLIDEEGAVCTLGPETRRAWHAGAGRWGTVRDVNSASIGIELANSGSDPFTEPQMTSLARLVAEIRARWDIPTKGVIGHSDMAPGRKTDPGALFDWRALAAAGQSIWPSPSGAPDDAAGFWTNLETFGYPLDAGQELVLGAFRLRFRPLAEGPPDATDYAIAADLADRFPVDLPRHAA